MRCQAKDKHSMEDLFMATNTVVRYTPADITPNRSMIEQLLDGALFGPTRLDRWVRPTSSTPANLVETPESFLVQISLPGLDSEKLEIQSLNRELRIHGHYGVTPIENGNYIWNGLPEGEFTKAFTLPAEVISDQADATYTNGILSITLPKADVAKVRNIPVKTTV
jgi:HSP20 family protein